MDISDPKIVALRSQVTAAQEEFDMAITFHEAWKPAAYDSALHVRMSHSYAGHIFLTVRTALRREMLLALMRLWTHRRDDVRLETIADTLRGDDVIEALAANRASRINIPGVKDVMMRELGQTAAVAVAIVDKYTKGSGRPTLEALQQLRNKRLAHRPRSVSTVTGADATDEEIEGFYQDMSKLIGLLLSLVHATAYNPDDTGEVYRTYARFFWAAVCGEKTEGHPNYRPPHLGPQGSAIHPQRDG